MVLAKRSQVGNKVLKLGPKGRYLRIICSTPLRVRNLPALLKLCNSRKSSTSWKASLLKVSELGVNRLQMLLQAIAKESSGCCKKGYTYKEIWEDLNGRSSLQLRAMPKPKILTKITPIINLKLPLRPKTSSSCFFLNRSSKTWIINHLIKMWLRHSSRILKILWESNLLLPTLTRP